MTTHRNSPARAHALRIGAIALLATSAALVPSLSANATTPDPTADQSTWTNVDTGEVGHFDSSIDPVTAIEAATGEPLVATPTTTTGNARVTPNGQLSVDSNFLLGIVYKNTSFGGASNSYFTTNSSICTNGFDYGFTDLGAFDDDVSSFQSFNGCTTTLYQFTSFGGTVFGPSASASSLGSFDNRASSAIFG